MNKFYHILILIFITSSCTKDENTIPEVYVNFRIQASEIGGVGSAIYTNDNYGVRGIIIYYKNTNEYVAYDRTCSYRPSNSCEIVEFNDELNPVFLVDSCCTSRFLLDDGTPFSGPALLPLKQYFTSFDGNYITVSN